MRLGLLPRQDLIRLAALVVPFLALAAVATQRYGEVQRQMVFSQMSGLAELTSAVVDRRLIAHSRSLRIFEAGLGHGATVEQAFLRQAEFALPAEPEWRGMRLTGLIPQTPPITVGTPPLGGGSDIFIPLQSFALGSVMRSTDGVPYLILREDILVGDSSFRLEVFVRAWSFSQIVKQIPVEEGWLVGVLDHTGLLIGRNAADTEADQLIARMMPPSFSNALSTYGTVTEAVTAWGQPIYVVAVKSEVTGWTALVAVPQEDVVKPLRRTRWIVLLVAGLCLALAFVAALLVVQNQRRLTAVEAEREAKDLLTREVHHRVKNSLQAVSSLLVMQAAQNPDPLVRAQFMEATARVSSIAQVHERLYRSASGDSVDFGGYLESLATDLAKGLLAGRPVGIDVEAATVDLPSERAVPLALIVAELITNAGKYAFPDHRSGRIRVGFSSEDGFLCLVVSDNGIGLPAEFDPAHSKGLGMRLVTSLVKQMKAELIARNEPMGGARFVVRWKKD